MAIWFQTPTLEQIGARSARTAIERLGIEFTEVGDDFLAGRMPVDHRTHQPAGILHGGASAVLAETLASTAGNIVVDMSKFYCVGLEINANHIRSVSSGWVSGRAAPIHLGRTTQVWEIRIQQDDKLVCVSRLTLAVLSRGN